MTADRSTRMERPVLFTSDGHELLGIVHVPNTAIDTAVIMLPAGPQYRVGPHRQHLLMARALAERGIATLRYDSSGTADSSGPYRDFDLGPDIDGAIDAILGEVKPLKYVVLWGICGSASAILAQSNRRPAVTGLILVNPFIPSEASRARTYLRYYYLQRLVSRGFWRKLFSGRFELRASVGSLLRTVRTALASERAPAKHADRQGGESRRPAQPAPDLEVQMAGGFAAFSGRVLFIMSENDLTSREFDEFTRSSKRWAALLGRPSVERRELRDADHLFSEPRWREQVVRWMADWVHELSRAERTRHG